MKQPEAASPKPSVLKRPLDDTVPTQVQYNRLYTLAKRIHDVRPWEDLDEDQVLAVERNADETDFISVMGALGSHFAVAVYPSLVTLLRIMQIDPEPTRSSADLLFELPQLQLVFGSKTALLPGEREAIAASGVTFKNGKWPSAQSYVPGYFPWKVGGQEIETFCVTLEQFVAKLDEGGDIPTAFKYDDAFCTRTFRDDVWREEIRRHKPKVSSVPIDLPADLIETVMALPVGRGCIEMDCIPVYAPVGARGARPTCMRHLVMADRTTKMIICMNVLQPEAGHAWTFMIALVGFLEQLAARGYRPESLAIGSQIAKAWAEPVCEMLGIRVDPMPCRVLIDYRTGLERFLQR